MSVGWQRIRLPLLERLALAELARKRSESEEAVLAELVRQAVRIELTTESAPANPYEKEASRDTAPKS